jgi:DNA-binding transcriptional MerR regulator
MVRKRSYFTRARAKRSRPKTPAPKTGWVIAELARLAELPQRRVRYYLEHELITPSEFRGTATRYQRRELMRLLGVVRLRADTRAKLADIKRRLDVLGERELEAWLRTQPLPLTAAAALGLSAASTNAPRAATQAAGASTPSIAGFARQASTWRRVCLLPGLELAIAADASPAVVRAAQQICEAYVGVVAPGTQPS